MNMPRLSFKDAHIPRPKTKGLDIVTQLEHFAIITYLVNPQKLQALLPGRFKPETIEIGATTYGLLSVVPFIDKGFYIQAFPWLKFNFHQTNYRIYIIDQVSGERGVWFLGTTLGSYSVYIPKTMWQMPWHYARYHSEFESNEQGYSSYIIEAISNWDKLSLHLRQSDRPLEIEGFSNLETALVILTHPLTGYFMRSDGQISTYSIWHEPLKLMMGECLKARFTILAQLGLVPFEEQAHPFNILLQAHTEFIIQLPPKIIKP